MRCLAILTVCCLISFAWCFSLDDEETLDGLLEQLEREELVEELEDEIDERMKLPAVSSVKRPPFVKPVRPVTISNPCSRACCDKRQTKVYLGDLAPGVDNGMPGIVTVLQPPTPNGNEKCSKTALLKVRFDKFGGCPFCGRYLLRIDLELSRVARPPASSKKFMFNIGDSQSNNGFKGDSNHQTFDAEADGLGNNINVWSNDNCKRFKSVSFPNAIGPDVSHVSIYIGNEYIRVTNDAGMDQELCSDCLYALNMQPDKTVNQDIYVALNRVVSGTPSRNGYGVCAATLSWDCGKY